MAVLGHVVNIDLNAVADYAISIDTGFNGAINRYIIEKILAHDSSVNLSASNVQIELRDAPNGGGNLLATTAGSLNPNLLRTLSNSTKFVTFELQTLAQENLFANELLYFRVTVVHGSQANLDLAIVGEMCIS